MWRVVSTCLLLIPSCLFAVLLAGVRMDSLAAPAVPASVHPALSALPPEMLWAWERPEDLRWLPANVGVAYVASTVLLRGDEALVHPRSMPLRLSPGTALV